MVTSIVEILKNGLAVLRYFFDPRLRKKRELKEIWNKLKNLERQYRKALADKNPVEASRVAKLMEEERAKIKFLNKA